MAHVRRSAFVINCSYLHMQLADRLRLALLALLVIAGLMTAARAQADQAAVGFTVLFGDEARAVDNTEATDDDARFAEKLFGEAESAQHPPELTIRLYEKAYHYGLRDVTGFAVADRALGRLVEKDATRSLEVGEMRLVLLEKWHESERSKEESQRNAAVAEDLIDQYLLLGRLALDAREIDRALKYLQKGVDFATRSRSPRKGELTDAIMDLYQTRKLLKEIEQLQGLLATDATAADKLAMIYLTQLDDPAQAATYVERMQDQALAASIRLAATEFEVATPANAKDAGAFYLGLVTDGKAPKPVPMLIRAKVWLTEYLSREEGEVQEIKLAHDMMGQVDQALLAQGVGQKLGRKMAGKVRGDGQFARPADVQAAIDLGVRWLYTQRDPQRHWEQDPETHRNWGGWTSLAVYALLMADEDPQTNSALNRAANFVMNADLKGTYPLCFRIHVWEVLPQRERFRKVLTSDVSKLRGGMTRYGFWGYTMAGNDVDPDKKLDLSTTLAGGLGVWIGESVGGIKPKPADWERIALALIKYQREDFGWAYNPALADVSHGSMTAGALALLYASYPHLTDQTKAKVDQTIAQGVKWMDANFSPTTNVNRGSFTNYYFAAVQHAGLFSGQREFRDMDWYESIKKHLLETQFPDGSWGNVQETAFAIAFLCRGGIIYEPSIGDQVQPAAGDDAPAQSPAE